jgi:hypothetical protein
MKSVVAHIRSLNEGVQEWEATKFLSSLNKKMVVSERRS